ncbi:hypothetical protein [Peribacillus asahii]|uniref:hypothetical protein n=1 Tax=Peribacillus asahii TaxID=228899 RepID=UPI00207A352B|nr:hypothetical protein [Peribacillus asahii]USK72626.1 hypothetical protein LIS76_23565 [Peribacillus asahii]USK72742.1 hypothetical protein LIS76_23745 [Peribacillus asahii]
MTEIEVAIELIGKSALLHEEALKEIEIEIESVKKMPPSPFQKEREQFWQHKKEIHLAKREQCFALHSMINEVIA